MRQPKPVNLTTSIREVNNIGLSIFLYFHTIVGLCLLLLSMLLIYGIFALATNILAANNYRLANINTTDPDTYSGILVLSLGSKIQHNTPTDKNYYWVQCWIGVGMIVFWGLLFLLIKYRSKIGEKYVGNDIKSVADFSISIENIPMDMTEDEL